MQMFDGQRERSAPAGERREWHFHLLPRIDRAHNAARMFRHFRGVTTQSCGYLPVQSRDDIAAQVKGEGSLTTNDSKASCLNGPPRTRRLSECIDAGVCPRTDVP
jgi:hypothetical protein